MKVAKLGDRVRVQYLGLPTGTEVAAKRNRRQVLEFTVGSREVIPGISVGVVGMVEGEQKRLTLQPKDAYGTVRRKLIREVPRKRFPSHLNLHVGKLLISTHASSGKRRRVKIVEIKRHSILVDGNHPLAGRVLEVEVQLVSLDSSAAESSKSKFNLRGETN